MRYGGHGGYFLFQFGVQFNKIRYTRSIDGVNQSVEEVCLEEVNGLSERHFELV